VHLHYLVGQGIHQICCGADDDLQHEHHVHEVVQLPQEPQVVEHGSLDMNLQKTFKRTARQRVGGRCRPWEKASDGRCGNAHGARGDPLGISAAQRRIRSSSGSLVAPEGSHLHQPGAVGVRDITYGTLKSMTELQSLQTSSSSSSFSSPPSTTHCTISPSCSSSSSASKEMDSPSTLDKDFKDIELKSASIPSESKSTSESTAVPLPSVSISPDPSNAAGCETHGAVVDLPPTTTCLPKAPAKLTFAAMAKKVIIQERIRKAEEEDAAAEDEDGDPDEEELTLEQLEEKAHAGDARAQTQLGQHYLIVAEEKDRELNSRQGVSWLLKAAKQGRVGAARLLRRCWIQNKESKFELAVRKAAMLMYWKLNPDRKQKLAVTEMLQNVSQVNTRPGGIPGPTMGQTQQVLQTIVSSKSQDLVSLDDFVEITKQFAQGISSPASKSSRREGAEAEHTKEQDNESKSSVLIPGRKACKGSWGLGQGGMLLDTNPSGALKRAMAMKSHLMMLQYPLHIIVDVKEHLVDWASRAGVQWLSTIIPTQHVNALIFFFIISNLTVDLFAFVIPLLVFYLSFISMIFCTLRAFQSSKTWENFSVLTALLTRFEPGLDVEQAESNFGWNNLEPHLYFILSVFFVIFSFPVADKMWIPCSELSTVAIFFFVISYMSLSPVAGTYARRAMVIEVASSLCDLTRFLPERMALRILGRTFATLPLGESVVLKLSLPCVLYVYLFYLFFSMARSRGFRGTYCFLVPYLVCFMWWEFSVVLLQNSSAVGLIRTCVAYFLLLFALPVLALGLALMLLIQLVKWFLELEVTKMVVTLALLSILDVLRSLTHGGVVKLILFCVSMVVLFFWMYVYHTEGLKVYNSTMTWNQYGQLCGPPPGRPKAWPRPRCSAATWRGTGSLGTGASSTSAWPTRRTEPSLSSNILPVFMGDWLRCLYGETYPKCEVTNATLVNSTLLSGTMPLILGMQEEEELCQIKAVAKHSCHVKRFDSFRFEVTVGMIQGEGDGAEDPGNDIILQASHEFKQVILNLQPGNVVEFSTKLEGRLGAKAPMFELKAIHCLDCAASPLNGGRQVKIERNWRRNTLQAMKFAFEFFFSPFFIM
ncbi:hypothetical protein CRUP_001912, partial [Coryphaenoides rupestris]